jgi:hypothetical protein
MSFEIVPTAVFMKEARRLAKKYPSLKDEIAEFRRGLAGNPRMGVPLGSSSFKNRLAIKSKGKGKSGGARVITCVYVDQSQVFLLTIYDKAELDTITANELGRLLQETKRG